MHSSGAPHRSRQSTPKPSEDEARSQTIPVVQEEASISSVAETTGKVRVRMASHEEKQQVPVTEIFEEVSVERVPINRFVSERTGLREEGDVVIIPVFETVSVVEQRLLLKEEVRIVRRRREVQREEEVVLRKETPIVERQAPDQEDWSQDPSEK